MHHNPAAGAIITMLSSPKMQGMLQAVGELTEQGAPVFEAAVPILSQLLTAETAHREVRSTAYSLKAARFPSDHDFTGFDFVRSEVTTAEVLQRCARRHSRIRWSPRNQSSALIISVQLCASGRIVVDGMDRCRSGHRDLDDTKRQNEDATDQGTMIDVRTYASRRLISSKPSPSTSINEF